MSQTKDILEFPLLGEFFNHSAIEKIITGCRYDRKRFGTILARHAKYRERYLRFVYRLLLELEVSWRTLEESGTLDIRIVKPFIKFTSLPIFVRNGKKNLTRDDVLSSHHYWFSALGDAYTRLSKYFAYVCRYMTEQGLSNEIKAIPVAETLTKVPEFQHCRITNNSLLVFLSSSESPSESYSCKAR